MPDQRMPSVTLENVRIGFRNFSGRKGQYNQEGKRNFHVFLPKDVAALMEADGWNIKWLAPREEGEEPQAHMEIKVNFHSARPPRVTLITSRGKTQLEEDSVSMLDFVEIKHVDMIVNPSPWEVRGQTGIAAYLKSIFITIVEDELDLKYADVADVPDSASASIQRNAAPLDEDDTVPWDED